MAGAAVSITPLLQYWLVKFDLNSNSNHNGTKQTFIKFKAWEVDLALRDRRKIPQVLFVFSTRKQGVGGFGSLKIENLRKIGWGRGVTGLNLRKTAFYLGPTAVNIQFPIVFLKF